jgi:hydroxyacylglutathione hydrolase
VRTDLQFDEAHIPGAVGIPVLRAGFGTKLAWLADRDQDVVIVGRDDDEAHVAARLAVAVGIRRLAGVLSGGMTTWRAERREVERIARLPVSDLASRLDSLQLVDVREESEWRAGHIPGSVHIPYHDIHSWPDELDASRPVAAICASGQRAAVAASLLKRFGGDDVIHVVDGGVGDAMRRLQL